MKKVIFILSFIFVGSLAMSTYANMVIIDNSVEISIVEDVDDKKPCAKDCTADCCTKDAKAETKSGTTATKSCSKTSTTCTKGSDAKKAECTKTKE